MYGAGILRGIAENATRVGPGMESKELLRKIKDFKLVRRLDFARTRRNCSKSGPPYGNSNGKLRISSVYGARILRGI